MKTSAPCPFCGKTLTRESSLKLDATPGEQAYFTISWRVRHEQPLCYDWESKPVTAADLLAAFSDEE